LEFLIFPPTVHKGTFSSANALPPKELRLLFNRFSRLYAREFRRIFYLLNNTNVFNGLSSVVQFKIHVYGYSAQLPVYSTGWNKAHWSDIGGLFFLHASVIHCDNRKGF
jgi:hypothetical protein